ncbi:MAG: type I methionyl aminopeptidase [Aggregatilineales bacterium]
MVIKNETDLQGLMRIGQICGHALQYMLSKVEPGITTAELDRLGAAYLQKHSAQSAPITAYDFPGYTCISVNEAIAHGVPDSRVIQAGDIVNIDVSAVLEGYWGDTGASMIVPPVNPVYQKLCDSTRKAMNAGIAQAKAGQPLHSIGRAIEKVAKKDKYRVIRSLAGHGVGRSIHENPTIFNYYTRRNRQKMQDGMVFTIEPFFNTGKGMVYTDSNDKWTLKTTDHTMSAQYEHTVIVNGNDPILVTKVDGSH